MKEFVPRQYVAWDGEGVTTEDGEHRYVLLAALERIDGVPTYIFNPDGLATEKCLEFFWQFNRRFHRPWPVIYGGSYDVNCICRDLTRVEAGVLWTDGLAIEHGRFEIDYQTGVFGVRKLGSNRRLPLWDVVKFYQSTFVKAVRQNLPDFPVSELREIEEQKARRSQFHVEELRDILHYTGLELKALLMLMHQLDHDLIEAGIGRLRQLYGAGSIAGALMNKYRVKKYMDRTGYEWTVPIAAGS